MMAQFRERAKFSQAEAGRHISLSVSRINRLEQGAATLSIDALSSLLDLYAATPEEKAGALELGNASQRRVSIRQRKTALPDSFQRFAELEENAAAIYSYQPTLVPGLMQCPEYAEALITS